MNDERAIIDPDDKYPSGGLRIVERHALALRDLLPNATMQRTRDVIEFIDPDESAEDAIVLVLTPEAIELRHPTTEWTGGAYGPAPSSTLWRRRKWSSLDDSDLPDLIDAARRARVRQYRTCRYCGKRFSREHMIDGDVCHGCASEHLGVAF